MRNRFRSYAALFGRVVKAFSLPLSVAAFSVFVFLSPAHGADPAVERIQEAYRGITDLKGSFVQKSTIKDLGRTETFKGTLMIKMPAKMRWHYSGNEKQTEVIINGDEMTVYQKSEKQAFKGRFDRETYGQAPIALLGGFGTIEKEFEITRREGRLLLRPKRPMGSVQSIELTPSEGDFPIKALTIIDRHANRVDITFRDISVNTGIPDASFVFSLPKGVAVYEYDRGR